MHEPLLEYRREGRLRDLTPAEWAKVLTPRCKYRAVMLSFAMFCALCGPAQADPLFSVTLNEQQKYYRNSGTIVLHDPFDGHVLGEYRFVTGGSGRGSLPLGTYEVGAYRDDPGTSFTRDSQAFRRRWMIRQTGLEDGEAYDRGDKRVLLELHSVHSSGATAGCIGVVGDAMVWDQFVRHMEYLRLTVGTIAFEVVGNPDGQVVTVANAAHAQHLKRHKTKTRLAAKHYKTRVAAAKHKRHRHRVAQCSCSYVVVGT